MRKITTGFFNTTLLSVVSAIRSRRVCLTFLCADLATGKLHRRVPFGLLQEDTSSFIPSEYRPPGIIFKDPRNMHREHIFQALRHCYQRQQESGPESSFRFALVTGTNRKWLVATYPPSEDNTATRQGPDKRKKKAKQVPERDPVPRKRPARGKKNKGKHRVTDKPDGLLMISEPRRPDFSGPDNITDPDPIQPDDRSSPVPGNSQSKTDELHWVRIDLAQMNKLKELGYQVHGPINGPNEGFPEYQVPKSWLDRLNSHAAPRVDSLSTPTPTPSGSRPYPKPRPIKKPSQPSRIAIQDTDLDPALRGTTPRPQSPEPGCEMPVPGLSNALNPDPSRTPVPEPESDMATNLSAAITNPPRKSVPAPESGLATHISSAMVLGKRNPKNRSPTKQP